MKWRLYEIGLPFVTAVFWLHVSLVASAQVGQKETIEFLNSNLMPDFELAAKKNQLEIKAFTNGKQVKKDHVFIADLDERSLEFIADENTVRVKCIDGHNDCVERILLIDDKKSYRGRVAFELPTGKDPQPILKGLRHLIMLEKGGKKYNNLKPFE